MRATVPIHTSSMQHLGRYELLNLVGRGGMAEVFEARTVGANGFRRRVAIKRMLDIVVDDPSSARMFLDEARLASALHHDSIVALLDYGIDGKTPFQVMEYVDGIDAAKAVRRLLASGTPMPEAVALHVCKELAHALAYAHEATDADGLLGIVHRDVKPSNVLLGWDGAVKLADFGIAMGRGRTERTEAGQVKGTPNYMAPEQLVGLDVDGRADVFGLGCVLHALLTGASPLAGLAGGLELLQKGGAPTLSSSLSPDIGALITNATQGRPEDRFRSARALGAALDGLVAVRGTRDLRSALVECLRPLRCAPAPSLFDDFLGAGFSLGTPTDDAGETGRESARVPVVARLPDDRTPPRAPSVARSRLRRAWLFALPGLLLALVGTWALTSAKRGGGEPIAVLPAASAAPPAPEAGERSADSAAPTSAPSAVAPPPPPSAAAAARPRSAERAPARGAGAPTVATAALASDGTSGFVRVRAADGNTTTKILVDGAQRGFAPRVLELVTGTHVLSFVDASGRTLGTTRVAVGPELTRHAPKDVEIP